MSASSGGKEKAVERIPAHCSRKAKLECVSRNITKHENADKVPAAIGPGIEAVKRKVGIDILSNIPWGTHICLFYKGKQDLIDILVPYFKAGLDNNEFCMWVCWDPLRAKEARLTLSKVLLNIDEYIKRGQIETVDYSKRYTVPGDSGFSNMKQFWVEKEKLAFKRGFAGLRLAGNTYWLQRNEWKDFVKYEEEVDKIIREHKMLAICPYSLDKCGVSEVIDVVGNHKFAIIRRRGKWEIIESAERKKAEEALQRSEAYFRALTEDSSDIVIVVDKKGNITYVSPSVERSSGYKPEDLIGKSAFQFIHPDELPRAISDFSKAIQTREVAIANSFRVRHKDGSQRVLEGIGKNFLDNPLIAGFVMNVRDVTDRKRAEETYHALVDHSLQGLAIFQDGRVVFANQAMAEVTGYSIEQMLAMPAEKVQAFVHAEDRALVWARHQQRLAGKNVPDRYQFRGIRRDGTICWLELNASRIDYQGQPAIQAAYIDITERKKVEDALRESEEKYRDLFENARDAIITTDLGARITGVNKVVEEYGFKKEQLLGKSIFDFIVEEQKERGLEDFKATISGNPVRGEMDVITPRGIFTAEYMDNPIKRAGQIIGIQAILRDITERKRAERLLRKERDKAQKYLDVAAVLLVAIDSEQRVGLINKKGCEILGYKEEEILGKNWFDNFLPERIRDQVKGIFEKTVHKEIDPPEYYENFILTKNGDERLIAWHNTVLRDEKGSVIAILSSGEDITQRKKAELKLLEYQKKLRSLASQLTLAEERERRRIATELHDRINQSLAISKIKLDALRHSVRSGEQARALEEVCNSLGQAIAQTRSLTFDLSSPVLHELGFEAAVASWLAEQVETKHHISTKFEEDGQPKPLDDDVRAILFRNIRELLMNVIKHAKAHNVKVSVHKIGDRIQVHVQDDGVGFEPVEALAKAARERRFGLFSAKERLEQIGGNLEIESALGQGCKVTMTAPLNQNES